VSCFSRGNAAERAFYANKLAERDARIVNLDVKLESEIARLEAELTKLYDA
jgi:hypothetical protein